MSNKSTIESINSYWDSLIDTGLISCSELCDCINALEKQAFFENEVDKIKDWFIDNKECLSDTATNVSTKGFNLLNKDWFIDDVDLDGIVEDIVDEIQKGILNVLDTYLKD